MKIRINSSIKVAELIDALDASPTRAKNLKYKIYYFLSLITDTNDNYHLNEKNDGFHNLCSSEIKKTLGNKDFYFIRKLLLNPNNPIIEVDNSWHNPKGKNSSGFCQGYRITPKYNTGDVVFKSLPKKLSKLIEKNGTKSQSMVTKPDYSFLLLQFERNTLTFDPTVYEYVNNFGLQLLQKVQNHNVYQIRLIHNLIGRWLYYIQQIESGEVWRKVSERNHRLNSSITNLPKVLRPFLLCNGLPLQCVDISSSQPYILSSVMQSRFYQEVKEGYNLKSIYSELYKELVDNGNIVDSMGTSITYSSNVGIQYYTSHTGYTTNSYSNISNSSSFMWCDFFTTSELDSINRYTQSPFYLDFYSHVLDRYYSYTKTPVMTNDREKLKNTMMYVLFDDNRNHRNNNNQIQIFQSVFPGMEKWINQIHTLIGKQRFSYLLQRSESYLLLGVICREFNYLYPDAPLFTIHDGVFTTEAYIRKLNGFILKRLIDLTGILAGCKIKSSQIDPNPQIQDFEKQWAKIEPINTDEKYLKNINGVFTSNITRGSKFLMNFSAIFIFLFSINCHFIENFGKNFANKSDLLKEFRGTQGVLRDTSN